MKQVIEYRYVQERDWRNRNMWSLGCERHRMIQSHNSNSSLLLFYNFFYANLLHVKFATISDTNYDHVLLSKLNNFYFSGMVIGSYFWGCLADTKGRKVVLIGALLMDGVVGLLSSIAQVYWLFMLLRFFNGFA